MEFLVSDENKELSQEARQRKDKLLLQTWHSLTFTERKYYEAWVTWKTFRRTLPPWKYFNTKNKILRDHVLMIEQFEKLVNARKDKRREAENHKDEMQRENNSRPSFGPRANKTISVL